MQYYRTMHQLSCSAIWRVKLSLNANRIQREFDHTAVQGHPRSSILVSMESPCVTSY